MIADSINAAIRRRNPDPELAAERTAYHEKQDDWAGECGYCKKKLLGTLAQLRAHTCPEFEASNESGR